MLLYQSRLIPEPVLLLQIGDIPEAEVKPPENVLFVCKLNPVTEVGALYIRVSQ